MNLVYDMYSREGRNLFFKIYPSLDFGPRVMQQSLQVFIQVSI